MIVISEAELGIVCDSKRCTGQACYVVVLHGDSVIVRMYCSECTRALTESVAKVMRDNDIALHDVLEFDHLLTGQVI